MILGSIEVRVGKLQGATSPSAIMLRSNVIDSVEAPGKVPAVPEMVKVSVYDAKILSSSEVNE